MQNFNLNTLNGANGFYVQGSANYGAAVRMLNDMNGDGLMEVAIGSPAFNNSQGMFNVIFGSDQIYQNPFNTNLLNGQNGFSVYTDYAGFPPIELGTSFTSGDFDCNNVTDFAFSAPFYNVSSELPHAGAVYILWNQESYQGKYYINGDLPSSISTIFGVYPYEAIGSNQQALRTIDFNDDSCSDLVIGAPAYSNNAGIAYVLFGNPNFAATTLSNLNGANGFIFEPTAFNSQIGYSVSNLGDINGDLIDDLAIGAPEYQTTGGAVYVLFGGHSVPKIMKPTMLNGENGFSIIPGSSYNFQYFGSAVTGAYINEDGLMDIVFSAMDPFAYKYYISALFVYGNTTYPAQVNFSTQDRYVYGAFINIPFSNYLAPVSSFASGNFSGDEYSTLAFVVPGGCLQGCNSGNAYLFQQFIEGYPASGVNFALSNGANININYGTNGLGSSVDFGDMNGDGYDDFVVGASWISGASPSAYIIFGSPLL